MKINELYWNDEKGAFIDSFESGKNNVSRHANIFALLFDFTTEKQRESIVRNVILNDEVQPIKTPYFKFYELDAMCKIGKLDYVIKQILNYWGGMLKEGATSFWEEYDEELNIEEQLEMYGLKYAKSLCHAWGASPIYLIGRYYLGVRPTSAGYETFSVEPRLDGFDWVKGTVPIKNGKVIIELEDNTLEVVSNRDGG
jgi:alpha-L-rhamnosidase